MTLTEFLLARIYEDEERARSPHLRTVYVGQTRADVRELAECEAKHRIVGSCSPDYQDSLESGDDTTPLAVEVLRALALPYADHPDYDEAWRP